MKLIDNARKWYKLHSVQLAIVAGPAIGWALDHRYEVGQGIAAIGSALGLSDSAVTKLIGLSATLIAIGLRLRAQPSPPCPPAIDETDHAGA